MDGELARSLLQAALADVEASVRDAAAEALGERSREEVDPDPD
jgi:hypothetical protein